MNTVQFQTFKICSLQNLNAKPDNCLSDNFLWRGRNVQGLSGFKGVDDVLTKGENREGFRKISAADSSRSKMLAEKVENKEPPVINVNGSKSTLHENSTPEFSMRRMKAIRCQSRVSHLLSPADVSNLRKYLLLPEQALFHDGDYYVEDIYIVVGKLEKAKKVCLRNEHCPMIQRDILIPWEEICRRAISALVWASEVKIDPSYEFAAITKKLKKLDEIADNDQKKLYQTQPGGFSIKFYLMERNVFFIKTILIRRALGSRNKVINYNEEYYKPAYKKQLEILMNKAKKEHLDYLEGLLSVFQNKLKCFLKENDLKVSLYQYVRIWLENILIRRYIQAMQKKFYIKHLKRE